MKSSLLLAAAWLLSPTAFGQGHAHWSYQGHGNPAHWAQLDECFKTCKLGRYQSPIDVDTKSAKQAPDAKPIDFAYVAGMGEVVNNGRTLRRSALCIQKTLQDECPASAAAEWPQSAIGQPMSTTF